MFLWVPNELFLVRFQDNLHQMIVWSFPYSFGRKKLSKSIGWTVLLKSPLPCWLYAAERRDLYSLVGNFYDLWREERGRLGWFRLHCWKKCLFWIKMCLKSLPTNLHELSKNIYNKCILYFVVFNKRTWTEIPQGIFLKK